MATDLTDNIFGNLVVLYKTNLHKNKHGSALWDCRCICGNKQFFTGSALRAGAIQCSICSNLEKEKRNSEMIGRQFGSLTVLLRDGNTNKGSTQWLCECRCGKIQVFQGTYLRAGNYTQCSECAKKQRKESQAKHKIDMTGQTIHNLTFLEPKENEKWRCRCNLCGDDQFLVVPTFVKNGNTKSCGCLRTISNRISGEKRRDDSIIGQTFTYLTVLEYVGFTRLTGTSGYTSYKCKCICGNEIVRKKSYLLNGEITSCGCKTPERLSLAKGGTGTPYENMESIGDFIRHQAETTAWKTFSLNKHNYTCAITNKRGGTLNIHHKKSLSALIDEYNITKETYLDYSDKLFNLDNSVVLTEDIHKEFHKIFGSKTDIKEWMEYVYNKSDKVGLYLVDIIKELKLTEYTIYGNLLSFGDFHVYLYTPFNHHDGCVDRSRSGKSFISSLKATYKNIAIVYENEWLYNKEHVLNFLMSKFNKNSIKVAARKCEIKQLPIKVAKEFLNVYHIQRSANLTDSAVGIYYNSELLGVMTFGKHHRQGFDNVKQTVLNRFCIKPNVNLQGGASRLMAFAINNILKPRGVESILSWSDNRYSSGNVYKILGFSLVGTLPLDYSYVDTNIEKLTIESKQSNKKSNLGIKGSKVTEREQCELLGKYRIWDAGKMCWKLVII